MLNKCEIIAAKAIVEKEQKAYIQMFNGNINTEEWLQFYTNDARYMAPGIPTVCGKASQYLLLFLFSAPVPYQIKLPKIRYQDNVTSVFEELSLHIQIVSCVMQN